jgi:hypothetical protein
MGIRVSLGYKSRLQVKRAAHLMRDACIAHIKRLLHDIRDEYWKRRIVNSVRGIEILFNLELREEEIWRDRIPAESLWTAATDEVDVPRAKAVLDTYNKNPPPITTIRYNALYYLFMGTDRALAYALTDQLIDSIVVDVSRTNRISVLISEARTTLGNYLK